MKSIVGTHGRVRIPATRNTALAVTITAILAVSSPVWADPAPPIYSVILVAQAEPSERSRPARARTARAAPAEPIADGASFVEEVIVTAGKRLENIQDVPASVLVVTDVALERANVRDFDDLVKIAPSVTITKTSQPANNSINIRGIGTYAYSATESSVAVVIDDVPQAFQAEMQSLHQRVHPCDAPDVRAVEPSPA